MTFATDDELVDMIEKVIRDNPATFLSDCKRQVMGKGEYRF